GQRGPPRPRDGGGARAPPAARHHSLLPGGARGPRRRRCAAHRLHRALPPPRRHARRLPPPRRGGPGARVPGAGPLHAGGRMRATEMPSRAELLVSLLASEIEDGAVVATGVASPLPILAIAVARATHAPRLTY